MTIIAAGWLFFAGLHTYICAIMALVLIDVFTGIYASLKQGKPFKSRILRKGLVEKVIIYNLLLISLFILEYIVKTALPYNGFFIVNFSTVLIATYEISSILENLLAINPNMVFIKQIIALNERLGKKVAEDGGKFEAFKREY